MTRRTPGLYLQMHEARKLFRFIAETLAAGRRIQITTATRSTVYSPQHASLFVLRGRTVAVQNGRRLDCISPIWIEHEGRVTSNGGCHIRAVS